jgi:PEP-CTERM motif
MGKRMFKSRAMLLAGVSALAMLACMAEADAEKFIFTGGEQSFPVLVSGEYSLDVLGASGGGSRNAAAGLGAEVSGDISLTAGETLTLFVGGQGQNGGNYIGGGGGGGGGFVFLGTSVLAVAGGGGAAGYKLDGGPGQAGTAGGVGGGADGGAGGASGSGGRGGTYIDVLSVGYDGNGGGGAGVASGAAGYGGDGAGLKSGFGAKFPNGGVGFEYGLGGFGGGGGGGQLAGGGGGGFSGGGGGSGEYSVFGLGFAGGGGGSYLAASLFTDRVLTAGVNSGDGSITITPLTPAVPEPSTWAMMLAGFAGLGWLARLRRRKLTPA